MAIEPAKTNVKSQFLYFLEKKKQFDDTVYLLEVFLNEGVSTKIKEKLLEMTKNWKMIVDDEMDIVENITLCKYVKEFIKDKRRFLVLPVLLNLKNESEKDNLYAPYKEFFQRLYWIYYEMNYVYVTIQQAKYCLELEYANRDTSEYVYR